MEGSSAFDPANHKRHPSSQLVQVPAPTAIAIGERMHDNAIFSFTTFGGSPIVASPRDAVRECPIIGGENLCTLQKLHYMLLTPRSPSCFPPTANPGDCDTGRYLKWHRPGCSCELLAVVLTYVIALRASDPETILLRRIGIPVTSRTH